MITNKSMVKGSVNVSSWIWQVIIILLFACVVLSLYLKDVSHKLYLANKKQVELVSLGYNLKSYSDYLTAQARGFAVTGNIDYFKNYWDEVLLHKNRDEIIDNIRAYSADPHERQLLIDSKRNSDSLINTEVRSMKLVLSASNVPNDMLPLPVRSYRLNKQDVALTPNQKILRAQKILFDSMYSKDKMLIMNPVDEYNELVSLQLRQVLVQSERKVNLSNIFLILLLFICLLSSVATLWVKFKDASDDTDSNLNLIDTEKKQGGFDD